MKHSITQGNISENSIDNLIKSKFPQGIDFCYTDPPWGNMQYWNTLLNKNTNTETNQIDQYELEDRVSELISNYVNNYAFIIYGVHQADSLMSRLKSKKNVKDIQYYEKTYKSGAKDLTCCVICVTLNKAKVIDFSFLQSVHGLKGLKVLLDFMKSNFDYKTVLELFVGVGHYLKVLDKYGYTVIGNELNPYRLQKALEKL